MPSRNDKPPKNYLGDRLKDWLLEVMNERNLSFQKIEDNARRHEGATLGRGTIQQIANGDTTNPGIFTLVELSWGVEKPLEEVFKTALGGLLLNPEIFDKSLAGKIYTMTDQLPAAEQRIVRRYLQMVEREILRLSGCD